MSTSTTYDETTTSEIFSDPVAYLAELGIEAEVVTQAMLPAAA